MRIIVSNTGPVLHLYQADALDLLSATGEVRIPKAVETEITRQAPSWSSPAWLKVGVLTESSAAEALEWQQAGILQAGEAEAIALARQLKADWLLTDDAAARMLGQALKLEVHGSLGVVLWAAAVGHLNRSQASDALSRLAKSSLWISARVLDEARTALDQLFGE